MASNNDDDMTSEEFDEMIYKQLKDGRDNFKKEASEENPDPTAPNPYPKGTKEYEQHQWDCIRSLDNMHAKYTARWEETKKRLRPVDSKVMEEAKKRFESPGHYANMRKRLDEMRAYEEKLFKKFENKQE